MQEYREVLYVYDNEGVINRITLNNMRMIYQKKVKIDLHEVVYYVSLIVNKKKIKQYWRNALQFFLICRLKIEK